MWLMLIESLPGAIGRTPIAVPDGPRNLRLWKRQVGPALTVKAGTGLCAALEYRRAACGRHTIGNKRSGIRP